MYEYNMNTYIFDAAEDRWELAPNRAVGCPSDCQMMNPAEGFGSVKYSKPIVWNYWPESGNMSSGRIANADTACYRRTLIWMAS